MSAYAFDTLKAADALIAAGIDSNHARAITETMRDAVTEGVATKADIAELKADMLKVAVTVAFGIVAANAALTVTLFKLFGAP